MKNLKVFCSVLNPFAENPYVRNLDIWLALLSLTAAIICLLI
jgi:hypothetical protein